MAMPLMHFCHINGQLLMSAAANWQCVRMADTMPNIKKGVT